MTTEPIELLRQFVESYNDRSLPDAAADLFAAELVVVNESAGLEVEGIEAYLEHAYHGWIQAVPDAHVKLVDYHVDQGSVSCTLQSDGTFDGTLETPEGSIPGTGQPFEIELQIVADIEAGQVSRWVSSYDVDDWQRQVGLGEAA